MEEIKNNSGTIQFIVIRVGEEQYGIDIKYVDNIIHMSSITRVPKVASYVKGVINVRGSDPCDEYTHKNGAAGSGIYKKFQNSYHQKRAAWICRTDRGCGQRGGNAGSGQY